MNTNPESALDRGSRHAARLRGVSSTEFFWRVVLPMLMPALLVSFVLVGLDLLTKESVIHEVAKLKSELGFALVLVTHDPTEVGILCDSLAVIDTGRIVDRGRLDEFATTVRSTLGRAFAQRGRFDQS